MALRKLKADKLFDGYQFLTDKVLVTDETGRVEALVNSWEISDAESFSGILSPGFINAHCHLELSHMKGQIPEKTGLVDFVFKVVTGRFFPEEQILSAIAEAEDEMLRNGIVAVGDICNNTVTIPQKRKHRLHYFNFIESSGWNPLAAAERHARAANFFSEYAKEFPDTSISPHAPYSVSEQLWKLLHKDFENSTVTIHNQESQDENEFFQYGTGDLVRLYEMMKIDNNHFRPTNKTSLQSYFHHLSNAKKLILVHNVFTGEDDIEFIKRETLNGKRETYFCLCINANQYIEGTVPPIDLLRNNNCKIVLGTDSLASNHALNIAGEMKTIKKFFPDIPTEEILKWATSNGADALGFGELYGSFDKGKKPGVVLLDTDTETFFNVKRII